MPSPEARQDGIIWKLRKAVYRLDDASREWYFSVKDLLLKNDCKQSSLDEALFRWYNKKGQLEGLILLHVDDFLLQEVIILQSLSQRKQRMHFELKKGRLPIFDMWDLILNRQQKASSFTKNII